jgi:predicted MPP superfamily phosphohydrolase
MNDIDIKLLNLLKTGSATVKDMKDVTHLNRYELAKKLNELKQYGYIINKLYAEEGFYFSLDNELKKETLKEIIINDQLRFITISDCHFGAIFERLDLIENIYNYAITNGINNVFNAGDLIQGYNEEHSFSNRIFSVSEQLDYVIKNYPYDNRIYNYILLGNHDFNSVKYYGFDISKQLENKRIDFTILGYLYGFIKANNDYICLHHPDTYNSAYYDKDMKTIMNKEQITPIIILRGHTHESGLYYSKDDILTLNIPCLCGTISKEIGAWDITLNYKDGYVTDTILKPLVVDKETFPYTKVLTKR